LRRIVFGSMSICCSCLEFVTLDSAFLCFGSVVEFDLLDGSISGVVFVLRECSDIGICLPVHGFKESSRPAPSSHRTLLLIFDKRKHPNSNVQTYNQHRPRTFAFFVVTITFPSLSLFRFLIRGWKFHKYSHTSNQPIPLSSEPKCWGPYEWHFKIDFYLRWRLRRIMVPILCLRSLCRWYYLSLIKGRTCVISLQLLSPPDRITISKNIFSHRNFIE
jgi:hypothetical protein